MNVRLGAKPFELLHEMLPDATLMGPQAQEFIGDVGQRRLAQKRTVAILRKDRGPVLASGPGT
jgi:hypothetical protein